MLFKRMHISPSLSRFFHLSHTVNVQFQKISMLPPQKGLEFPGGERGGGDGGSERPKNLKKCMRFNWNFHRSGEF